MSFLTVLALIFAVYFGLVLCFCHRERTGETHFDERQEQARGVAYKYGFFALAISIWLFSQFAEVFPWIGVEAGGFLCLSLGGTVFSVTAIRKDAYLRLHERPERTAAGLALGGVGCLCLSVFYIRKEGVLVQGTLNLWMVIAVMSLLLLVLLAVFLHRHFSGRREDEA